MTRRESFFYPSSLEFRQFAFDVVMSRQGSLDRCVSMYTGSNRGKLLRMYLSGDLFRRNISPKWAELPFPRSPYASSLALPGLYEDAQQALAPDAQSFRGRQLLGLLVQCRVVLARSKLLALRHLLAQG